MNPHERNITTVALPPSTRGSRPRRIIAIIAGVLVVGAAGLAGVWYFTYCGNCGRSPILCNDPCELPTFG